MADFPTIDFSPYEWATLDQNYIVKWNGKLVALNELQANIAAFGQEVTQEKQAAASSAQSAGESAAEALQYRNEAQQIAAGDVTITSLQPGTLDTEKDYVSVDAQGDLVGRNLAADVSAQLSAGGESAKLGRYDLASISTTASLDLSTGNEFTIDASSPRTLAFANIPTGRSMPIILSITGSSAITWPAEMTGRWHGGAAPELGATWTIVVINYDGTKFSGVLGASA